MRQVRYPRQTTFPGNCLQAGYLFSSHAAVLDFLGQVVCELLFTSYFFFWPATHSAVHTIALKFSLDPDRITSIGRMSCTPCTYHLSLTVYNYYKKYLSGWYRHLACIASPSAQADKATITGSNWQLSQVTMGAGHLFMEGAVVLFHAVHHPALCGQPQPVGLYSHGN